MFVIISQPCIMHIYSFKRRERLNVATVAMFNTQNVATVGAKHKPRRGRVAGPYNRRHPCAYYMPLH